MKYFTGTMIIMSVAVMVLVGGQALAAEVAPPAPVSGYLFDEGSGTTTADAFGSNDGTLVNGPVWTNDTPFAYAGNYSLSRTNTIEHVNLGTPADLDFIPQTDSFTLAGWLQTCAGYTDHLGTGARLIIKGPSTGTEGQYNLQGNQTHVQAWAGGTGIGVYSFLPTTPPPGAWHHLAVVVTPTTQTLYVNAVVQASGGVGTVTSTNAVTLMQEIPLPAPGQYTTDNRYDELALWDTALSADNIEWLANNSIKDLLSAATPGTLIYGK